MEEKIPFIDAWNTYGSYVAIVLAGLGILTIVIYWLRLQSIKEYKDRYDFINKNEINTLWYAVVFILAAATVFANTLNSEPTYLRFFVYIFVSIMLALIIGVIFQNILRFYYPFHIEKRLKRLRYKPRVSPKTGKPMKLLSEEEEDVYLDEGMQAEENIYSIDYDVWVDEETGYTKIEKYQGHLHALQCPECNYQTFKVVKEEVVESPTTVTEGQLIKYFNCGYCGYKAKRDYTIAKLSSPAENQESSVATS